MKRRPTLIGAAAAALLMAVVAGCGGGSDSATTTTGPSTAGATSAAAGATTEAAAGEDVTLNSKHRGGTMKLLWNSIGSSIDPGIDYDANWQLLRMTNDGLVAWKRVAGQDGNTLVPDIAEEIPEATDGGLTYAFKVRPGVKFSTGAEVKPSDFKATIERQFKLPGPVSGFYAGVVGGDVCAKTPEAGKTCDLAAGITADDAAMTLTFKLAAPDANFIQKLALPFAYVLPADTAPEEAGTKPLPATGPYMIESYAPNQSMNFVRNPEFVQWSQDAQPNGYPDRIELNLAITAGEGITQVENGDADWIYDQPPADRLGELGDKYADRLSVNNVPQAYHMVLNTKVPPFDNLQVRQAVNYATDRAAIQQLWGGPSLATIACQILPPNFPSYKPYCPYTLNPGETWSAPDVAKAKQLVDASGTKGTKVEVIITPDDTTKAIGLYFVSLLNDLGFKATTKTLQSSVSYSYVQDSGNKAQMTLSYWYPDYPAASNFLDVVVGCKGFHASSTASPNLSEFCDDAIEAKTNQALALEQTDPGAAAALWTEVDKETTDAAPWVSLFVQNRLDFVSERVGNFQFNPSVVGGFMIESAWVQ